MSKNLVIGDVTVEDNKFLNIDFPKIFNNPDLDDDTCCFHLKKRAFYGFSDMIAETIDRYFKKCDLVLVLNYYHASRKIKKDYEKLSINDISDIVINSILTPSVVNDIDDYIETSYDLDLDAETKKNKNNVNIELVFTDHHTKMLYKISEAMRLTIPLITEYCSLTDCEIDENIYVVFSDIIELFEDDDVNMSNKIHRFIYARIVSTSYSDEVMWRLNESFSKDVQTVTDTFFEEMITGIIPKSDLSQNLVNFLHVVTRKKLMYSFYRKFKVALTPVNLNQVDSDGLTAFDKLEINMSKKDESKVILNQVTIRNLIRDLLREFDYNFSKDEFIYYKENIVINNLQKQLVFLFYSKYVNGYINIHNASYNEYILLTMILREWLEENGYYSLAEYVIAIPNKRERRININKTKLLEKVIESKNFERLNRSKYRYSASNIVESGTIVKLIGNLSVSKFMKLPVFHEAGQYENDDIEIKIDLNDLTDEILNFIELI